MQLDQIPYALVVKIILFILIFLSTGFPIRAEQIVFEKSDGSFQRYDLEVLKKNLKTYNVKNFNQKNRHFEEYKAFSVKEFLPYVSGVWGIPHDLQLKTRNGYSPKILKKHLIEEPGYFAYEKIKGKMNTIDYRSGDLVETGPLYLIWSGQKVKDESKNLRWVYQIDYLSYANSVERGIELSKDAPEQVQRGMSLFASHCLRCHQKGGISSDLIKPSIFHTRKAQWIAKYIANPKSLNSKSRMPSFAKVFQEGSSIGEIVSFLDYKFNPNKLKKTKVSPLKELDKTLNTLNPVNKD